MLHSCELVQFDIIEINHIGLIKCEYIAFFDDVTILNLKKYIDNYFQIKITKTCENVM
jgi:hypothetical protein